MIGENQSSWAKSMLQIKELYDDGIRLDKQI